MTMKNGKKIWVGVELEGGRRVMRTTLKGVCEELGIAYTTAKRRQEKDLGGTVYVVEGKAVRVTMEEVL